MTLSCKTLFSLYPKIYYGCFNLGLIFLSVNHFYYYLNSTKVIV